MPDVRSRFRIAPALLVLLAVTPVSAEQPAVLIPATDAPPRIDGRIEPSEWADAAVITGFIQPQSSLLTPPGGAIYVKHDAEKLYLAFRSELLPGMVPTRRYRKRDEPVYMDSHQIELWLTPPVADAKTWAYQFIGNAYGAFFDNLQHPELGSTSTGWNGRSGPGRLPAVGTRTCRCTPNGSWEATPGRSAWREWTTCWPTNWTCSSASPPAAKAAPSRPRRKSTAWPNAAASH